MTKKQLRQRLKDLATGAGCNWTEEYKYFECNEDMIVCLDRFASALRDSDIPFSLDDPIYKLGLGWCKAFQDLDELTNYIYDELGD